MPDHDISLHAVYTCEAFTAEPPIFVVTDRSSTEGLLYWRVDTGIPTVHAVSLEYLTVNEAGESRWTPLYIPFDLGEIYDAETYPLIVSGKKVTSRNKDNILGDGTASYDPETRTLTLENATLDELYPVLSDAGLPSAAYAVVGARDLTVRLIGENTIAADRSSFCHGRVDHSFDGTIVGVGNAVNGDWRPSLTADDSFAITFVGDGSLTIRTDGDDSAAIHAIGDVTVDGPKLTLRAKHDGVASEEGSFIMNAGTVDIDTAQRSCVVLSGSTARFTVNGGALRLNGGTDSYAVSMSATDYRNAEYFFIYDGEMILQTKSKTWDLSSRDMY